MRILEALDRYLTQIAADGRSAHTAGQYRRHITLLAKWLERRRFTGNVEDMNHETLAQFLASAAARERPDGKTKRATSTNALRTSLRTFFRYAHEAGYVRSNPARLIRRALCAAALPRALSEDESKRLLAALAADRTPEARRDQALFGLMLGTGIRLGSALALELADLDLDRGEITLRRTKGNAPVVVLMSTAVRECLRAYTSGRSPGSLFTGRRGAVVSVRQVQRRFAEWCKAAGIERSVKPHDLRHSFAIRLYKRTGDLPLVQQALRHRSIASTVVYARCDDERLRELLSS